MHLKKQMKYEHSHTNTTIRILITLFFISNSSLFAYDYETPKQSKIHNYLLENKLDTLYSTHASTDNFDQRFWTLYNDGADFLHTARDQVNTTQSFVYQHNMANLSSDEQLKYKSLTSVERASMKKWYLKRDELLNLLFHATQSGVVVDSYENKVVDLMADEKRLEQNIANRPY